MQKGEALEQYKVIAEKLSLALNEVVLDKNYDTKHQANLAQMAYFKLKNANQPSKI